MNTTFTASKTTTPAINPIVLKILQKRFPSEEEQKEFLSWNLNELPDLLKLKDLDIASSRIIEAIKNKEKIGIYGDYDVDGITATAILYHFFKLLNLNERITCFQPKRFEEGYGLHPKGIYDCKKLGISLLVTVDCGISAVEAAEVARIENVDLIVTDHHADSIDVKEGLPNALAIVNPKRRDENCHKHLNDLAGVGVAFVLCWKIKKDLELQQLMEVPSIYQLLPFVAIGTLCDMVNLNSVNLKLIRHGLKELKKCTYPGLMAFFSSDEIQREYISSDKITFDIGPMINSVGRMNTSEIALNLLISSDRRDAQGHYLQLEETNFKRKNIQAQVFAEAKEIVLKRIQLQKRLSIIVVYNPNWHEGVIGIVASKLVDFFKVPSIVLTDLNSESENKSGEKTLKVEKALKASARSAGKLNIFELLNKCSDLLIKFGGHAGAAGFSMERNKLPLLEQKLNLLLEDVPLNDRIEENSFDLSISFDDVNTDLLEGLDFLAPYGEGNPVPIFRMSDAALNSFQIIKDNHVRWKFSSQKNQESKQFLNGISFNYIGRNGVPSPLEILKDQEKAGITVEFMLKRNYFNGQNFLQLIVERIFIGNMLECDL
ncbi:MAG: single-stranded-DNA-specific exonuclease RecJ [Oligoflexia bacterium]|nr:single-stranded-DNA-specific exonuclease RecJ [Oligoflexia bacterium]